MDSQLQLFANILRKSGHSMTKARLSLFKMLRSEHTFTISQLIAKLPKQDQASVYRNIKIFEEMGIANRLHAGWKSTMELSDLFRRHHHHLICLTCNRIMDLINDLPIEVSIAQVASQQGFTPLEHQLEIHGYCDKCQNPTL